MPISSSDEMHTQDHWTSVKDIFEEAINNAGLIPKAVWIGEETNIIQSKILKNLFDNDIVLCDVSTLNANVMLEFGMRLTTRKPTLIVAEDGTDLPFDTNMIHTEFYDPALTHAKIKKFIAILSSQLKSASDSVLAGTFKSFLEHFTFETVEPQTVTVSSADIRERKLEEMFEKISGIDRLLKGAAASSSAGETDLAMSKNLEELFQTLNLKTYPRLSDAKEKQVPRFAIGDRVFHQKFGEGTVTSVDGYKVNVDFEIGPKRVLDTFISIIKS